MPPTTADTVARLVGETAATMRAALDLASARADRLETALAESRAEQAALRERLAEVREDLAKDTRDRDHEKRDLLQTHDVRLVRLETQRGMAASLGGGVLGGVVSALAGLLVWAVTR